MKRCQIKDLNTAEWWDKFWTGPRGTHESNACPDVAWLLSIITTKKERVLDVGCGTGRYFPYLQSDEIHGVEISPAGVIQAKQNYPKAIVNVADVVKDPIPYPNDWFDVVYCGEMLEHIEDPARMIGELRRVCKVGGVVVMNTPHEDSIPADAHLWFFDNEDMINLFKDFHNRSIFRFNNCPLPLRWEHFLVVARK